MHGGVADHRPGVDGCGAGGGPDEGDAGDLEGGADGRGRPPAGAGTAERVRGAVMIKKRSVIIWVLLIGAVCVAGFICVVLLDFGGVEFAGKIRYHFRAQERLPVLVFEPGHMVTCRTRLCDFRFALPEGTRVVKADPLIEKELVQGAVNTLEGTIYVVSTNGRPINLPAYLTKAGNFKPGLDGWLNKQIVVDQTIMADSSEGLAAIHFHCMGDSTPLGYY